MVRASLQKGVGKVLQHFHSLLPNIFFFFFKYQFSGGMGGQGGHGGQLNRDPLPVFSAGGPCSSYGMGRDVYSLMLSSQHFIC